MSMIKEILWFGVSTAIIAGMIYFAGVNEFIDAIVKADHLLLIPAAIFGLSTGVIWAFSWYRIFQKVGIPATFMQSVKLHYAGAFLNNVTPLGQLGGEPFMAYIVSSNTDASYEKAFSAILSADIINSLPAFTFIFGGAVYVLFFHSIQDIIIELLYLAFTVVVVGGTLIYLLWFEAGSIEGGIIRLLNWLSGKLGRGERLVDKATERLKRFEESIGEVGEDKPYLIKTLMMIHAGFILEVLTLYMVLQALGIDPLLSNLYFILPLADIANNSPTPGGSGTYEAAMAWLITQLTPAGTIPGGGGIAVFAALLYRLFTYWPITLIGYFSLQYVRRGGYE